MREAPESVFGQVLRRTRREHDLSQDALADRAGLARNHVSELERGTRDPRLTTLIQLADGLGIGLTELIARFDEARGLAASA